MIDLSRVFFPSARRRMENLQNDSDLKLVHYTSAPAGLSILQHKQLWMRNVLCMNDYSEVNYPYQLFKNFFHSESLLRKRFHDALQIAGVDYNSFFIRQLDDLAGFNRFQLFVTCFSEHSIKSDANGKLSMWRGYGKDGGVAFVLNKEIFCSDFSALEPIYTTPVEYLNEEGFRNKIQEFIFSVESSKSELEEAIQSGKLNKNILEGWISEVLIYALISIKHPGFSEEKEWRVICPYQNQKIHGAFRDVNGIPQIIKLIPLTTNDKSGTEGFSISEILDHILIGPTPYAYAEKQAFVQLLTDYGVANATEKVVISNIPYRA